MKFADLQTRTVTAIGLLGGVLALELLQRTYEPLFILFPGVAILIVAECTREFIQVCRSEGVRRMRSYYLFSLVPALCVPLAYWGEAREIQPGAVLACGMIGMFFALTLLASSGRRSLEETEERASEVFLGTLLLGFGGACLVSLSLFADHLFLYWLIAVIAATDTGAYFVGIFLGKHRLSQHLSPGKSVEGLCGGVVSAALVGSLFGWMTGIPDLWIVLLLSIVVALFGQLFDLGKSFVKRVYGVKDTGALLPGHGGFLDRVDGLLGGAVAIHVVSAFLTVAS